MAIWTLVAASLACGCGKDSPQPGPAAGSTEKAASAPSTVRVAAASDLQFALPEVIAAYTAGQPDTAVEVSYGSSGTLFAQLSNKAPFDMFLSADMSYPRRLVAAGLAAQESEFLYAIGHIVVFVPQASTLDLDALGIKALNDPSVRKIAIANPQHAPYGRAAEAAMKHLGVYDEAQPRLVLGENVAQAAQFVSSGAADIGIIALSLARAPAMKGRGRYWQVPLDAYPRLEQGGVILNTAQDAAAAAAWRTFLTGEKARGILREYGFIMPGE